MCGDRAGLLASALCVKTDDLLKDWPQLAPWRPAVGIAPQLSDAELVTLAMMQAMLGFTRLLATDTTVWSDDVWSPTPRRSNADAPARPSSGPTWPDRPSTGTAPVTAASSGACRCTWCAPFRVCRSLLP